jgi:uncharacterized membrane protein YbhN (UPF0104 family)
MRGIGGYQHLISAVELMYLLIHLQPCAALQNTDPFIVGLGAYLRYRLRRAEDTFNGHILVLEQRIDLFLLPFSLIGFKQIDRGHQYYSSQNS